MRRALQKLQPRPSQVPTGHAPWQRLWLPACRRCSPAWLLEAEQHRAESQEGPRWSLRKRRKSHQAGLAL
eukprot:12166210-Alexandrium_andersonii.AAC.1